MLSNHISSSVDLPIEAYTGTTSDYYIEKFERILSFILEHSFWKGTEIIYYSWSFKPSCPNALSGNTKKVIDVASSIFFFFPRLGGCFIGAGWSLASIPIYFLAQLVRAPLNLMSHRGFAYLPGEKKAANSDSSEIRLCVLNTCMLSGCLPRFFGGQSPATTRVESLASFIKVDGNVPDLLFLCEVGRTVERSLVKELEKDYRHFFLGAGLSSLQESGLFVASNCTLTKAPCFKTYKTKGLSFQSLYNRGFFVFHTKTANFIFTHLSPGKKPKHEAIRQQQLNEIRTFIRSSNSGEQTSWILVGDLNTHQFDPKKSQNGQDLNVKFNTLLPAKLKNEPTTLDSRKQPIDHVLGFQCQNLKLKNATIKDKKTLSDHKAIRGTISVSS
ncbi:MAG: hypothetical protein AAF443_03455 [Chlamydiota bacterium]